MATAESGGSSREERCGPRRFRADLGALPCNTSRDPRERARAAVHCFHTRGRDTHSLTRSATHLTLPLAKLASDTRSHAFKKASPSESTVLRGKSLLKPEEEKRHEQKASRRWRVCRPPAQRGRREPSAAIGASREGGVSLSLRISGALGTRQAGSAVSLGVAANVCARLILLQPSPAPRAPPLRTPRWKHPGPICASGERAKTLDFESQEANRP